MSETGFLQHMRKEAKVKKEEADELADDEDMMRGTDNEVFDLE